MSDKDLETLDDILRDGGFEPLSQEELDYLTGLEDNHE